jgi:hypothetical protein
MEGSGDSADANSAPGAVLENDTLKEHHQLIERLMGQLA